MRDEVGGSETKGPEPDANGGAGAEQGSATGERTGAPSHDHHKHRWRRWVLWIVLLIIIALIAIWGIRKWLYSRDHESTDDAQIAGHLVPVLNRVSAYVTGVFVHNGDHVTTGQLLVRLEETDLRPALAEAEAAVAEAEAAVTSAESGARGAAARLEAARAAVEQARLQLSYTRITAPVPGIVANRNVDPGQLLEPGQPLMVVVADSGVHVTANFKETQVANLRPGQPVEIDIDAYGDCDARGVVESIGGATGSEFALLPPNNATGNFVKVVQRIQVRIVVTRDCGPARRLRPGMSVTVHVRTG
jgi:multidrug resistance efflux pump